MISIIVMTIILTQASAETLQDDNIEKLNNATKLCGEKHNLAALQTYEDYLKALSAGGERLVLFSECFHKELGLLNDNGEILQRKIKKIPYPGVSAKKFSTFVDECKNGTANSTSEVSYKFAYCLLYNINRTYHRAQSNIERQQQLQKQRVAVAVCSNLTNFKFFSYDEYIGDISSTGQKVQLFSECYLRELHYLNRNGEILYEDVKQAHYLNISSDKLSSFVDGCKNKTGSSVAEASFKFLRCVHTNVNEVYDQLKQYDQKWQLQKQQKAMEFCLQKTNLTSYNYEEQIQSLLPKGNRIQLFSECYLRQLGYLNYNNILYEEAKKIHYPDVLPEILSNFVDLCKSKIGKSIVETSYKFLSCIQTNVKQFYDQTKQEQQNEQIRKQQNAIKVCLEKANIFSNDRENVILSTKHKLQLQLFSECYLRKISCVDKNEKILYDEVKKSYNPGISPEKFSNSVDICKNVVGNSLSETAYLFLHCVQKFIKQNDQTTPSVGEQINEQNRLLRKQIKLLRKQNELFQKENHQLLKKFVIIKDFLIVQNRFYLFEKYVHKENKELKEEFKRIRQQQLREIEKSEQVQLQINLIKADFLNQKVQHNQEQQLKAMKICSERNNLTIRNNKQFITALSEANQDTELFSVCYLEELGYVNKNGQILYEDVKKSYSYCLSMKNPDLVDQCRYVRGNTFAKTSCKFLKCLLYKTEEKQQIKVLTSVFTP